MESIQNKKLKICQYGTDGFGHQLEGLLRVLSICLNNKAEFMYNFRKSFTFEHTNFDTNKLNEYLLRALQNLSNKNKSTPEDNNLNESYKIIYNEQRGIEDILNNDNEYEKTIYCYDGVGCGRKLPPNFEPNYEIIKSLPILRNAFIENNILPAPTYDNKKYNIVCHIRQGDAVGTRILDNDNLYRIINFFQKDINNRIIIHSDGYIGHLASDNTILHNKDTDVLQILSDFIHADILVINYSGLSIAAHLLAKEEQIVIVPNVAGPTFYHRILSKCIRIDDYLSKNVK